MFSRHIRILLLILLLSATIAGTAAAEKPDDLDWSAWQRLPVFDNGRIMPLETFARQTVDAVCDRQSPTLSAAEGEPRKFSAAELLFSWLVEPERWEDVPFLAATDETLREDWLGVPVTDTPGRRRLQVLGYTVFEGRLGKRYKYVSPRDVAEAEGFRNRLGHSAGPVAVEQKARKLYNAYAMYRLLISDPAGPTADRARFRNKLEAAAGTWQQWQRHLQAVMAIQQQSTLTEQVEAAHEALTRLAALASNAQTSLGDLEPAAARLARDAAALADAITAERAHLLDALPAGVAPEQVETLRKPMHALASGMSDFARQTAQTHLALYDGGYALRLVPGLDPAALENNRSPDDDAQPWASLQLLLYGSDDVTAGCPRQELTAFRTAFAEAAEAYRNRGAADRAERFSQAMDRLAAAARRLGESIEPAREALELSEADQHLIALTAYPPPGATELELNYFRLDPFRWSWVTAAVAMVFLGLSFGRVRGQMFWLGVFALAVAGGFTALGLGMRVAITGWAPVTNMFETVVFVALVVVALALWFVFYPVMFGNRRHEAIARKPFAVAGAMVAFFAALVAYFAPISGKEIGPIMPILRSNLWLTLHVLTITASYGAGLLALGLGNMAMGYYLFGRYRGLGTAGEATSPPVAAGGIAEGSGFGVQGSGIRGQGTGERGKEAEALSADVPYSVPSTLNPQPSTLSADLSHQTQPVGLAVDSATQELHTSPLSSFPSPLASRTSPLTSRPPAACDTLAAFTYKAIQVTVLLLAAGTILGALWADVSWGRFWDWDPKEVWALVSTLVYLAMLHARYVGWTGNFGMALCSVLGVTSIMMAWYGVSLLNSGLHTYGRITGGLGIVVTLVAIEWAFALLASLRYSIQTRQIEKGL